MATTISAIDGIKYGFKLLAYFLVVGIIGTVITMFGISMSGAEIAAATDSFREPNLVILLFGSIISMVGAAILYAGTLGVGYKVIADAVYTGNIEAEEHNRRSSDDSGQSTGATTATDGGTSLSNRDEE